MVLQLRCYQCLSDADDIVITIGLECPLMSMVEFEQDCHWIHLQESEQPASFQLHPGSDDESSVQRVLLKRVYRLVMEVEGQWD